MVSDSQSTLSVVSDSQSTFSVVSDSQSTLNVVSDSQSTLSVVSDSQSTLSAVSSVVSDSQSTLNVVSDSQSTLSVVRDGQSTLSVVSQHSAQLPSESNLLPQPMHDFLDAEQVGHQVVRGQQLLLALLVPLLLDEAEPGQPAFAEPVHVVQVLGTLPHTCSPLENCHHSAPFCCSSSSCSARQ